MPSTATWCSKALCFSRRGCRPGPALPAVLRGPRGQRDHVPFGSPAKQLASPGSHPAPQPLHPAAVRALKPLKPGGKKINTSPYFTKAETSFKYPKVRLPRQRLAWLQVAQMLGKLRFMDSTCELPPRGAPPAVRKPCRSFFVCTTNGIWDPLAVAAGTGAFSTRGSCRGEKQPLLLPRSLPRFEKRQVGESRTRSKHDRAVRTWRQPPHNHSAEAFRHENTSPSKAGKHTRRLPDLRQI